jgi:ABC-type antimicrobial peptide transport system permease subunit
VREFGTLKALGWRGRRVAGQVVGEALVQGVAGGALGAILGVLGAFAVSRVVPTLAATIRPVAANLPGGFGGGGGFTRAFGGGPQAATRTVAVHLSTPINFDLLALAIGLAILGGLMAGLAGGLRAARLRPAEAMRRVE